MVCVLRVGVSSFYSYGFCSACCCVSLIMYGVCTSGGLAAFYVHCVCTVWLCGSVLYVWCVYFIVVWRDVIVMLCVICVGLNACY